jgi:hypothetical protein
MPLFEIHTETYEAEDIPVIEAPDAYEAAIMFVARWAPVSIIRIRADEPGDAFRVTPTGSTGEHGVVVEVFEHDPTAEPWAVGA